MERWREIPGYEGIYEASDRGRLRTCRGKTTSNARYKKRVWKQRILIQKVFANKKGRKDARVSLWKEGRVKDWLVSRLIALTWCDGYSTGLTVNHKDGKPLNNHADNLEWITGAENTRKGFENNQYPTQRKIVLVDLDGNECSFRSMSEASRFLGYNSGYISNHLRLGRDPNVCGYTIRLA